MTGETKISIEEAAKFLDNRANVYSKYEGLVSTKHVTEELRNIAEAIRLTIEWPS